MALDSAWGYVVGPKVFSRDHNEMFESHVEPFHQTSPNLLIGLPQLFTSGRFCFVGTYLSSMNSWLNIFLTQPA